MSGCSVSENIRARALVFLVALCFPAASGHAQWFATGSTLSGAVVALTADSQYVYASTTQGRVWRRPIGELVTRAQERATEVPTLPAGSLTNFPNPCNASTVFEFVIPADSRVSLHLYDVLGRNVLTVLDLPLHAGAHHWAVNLNPLSTGIYLAVLTTGDFRVTRRILLVR